MRFSRQQRTSLALLMGLLAACGMPSAVSSLHADNLADDPGSLSDPTAVPTPAILSTDAASDDGRFDATIANLGSADPIERDAASRRLWRAGRAAQASMEGALDDPNPEVVRRLKEILRNFRFGLLPDTPREIIDLLEQYRVGQPQDRRTAIDSLAIRGAAGTRIILKLWQDETDDGMKRVLLHALTMRAQDAAMMLAGEGDWDLAEQLLRAAASTGADRVLRDYAAFLLTRGTLKQSIVDVERIGAPTDSADPVAASRRWLTYLHRANGDLPAARAAAERSGDERLVDLILMEQADWKTLATRAEARSPASNSIEQIGFAAAYQRLSGNPTGEQKWIDQLTEFGTGAAPLQPGDNWNVAKELLLSGRPEPATRTLLKQHDYSTVIEFDRLRLKFDDALGAVEAARKDHAVELPLVEISAATLLDYLGRSKDAAQLLDRIAQSTAKSRSPAISLALIRAAVSARRREQAEGYLATALGQLAPNDATQAYFEEAGYDHPDRAAQWWKYVRRRHKEGTKILMGRLRLILSGSMSASELEGNARLAEQDAAAMRPDERVDLLDAVAETLLEQGRDEAAYKVFERLGLGGQPAYLVRVGDVQASQKQFDQAAALYGRASEMNHALPLPVFLKGWAMTQIHREKEGRDLIEFSHALPLGDEFRRHEFLIELEKRNFLDDAAREKDLLLRSAAFMSWPLSDTLRRGGDEANNRGDHKTAAALWRRAFLDNHSNGTDFVEKTANLAMPVLVMRTEALAKMEAGDTAAGFAQATQCMAISPGDTDALIDLVLGLETAKDHADADTLYHETAGIYEKLCDTYPASAGLHNQFAWAAAKCKRDLDKALTHARRAVEIEPDNASIIDTLAETYFQRGEIDKAIEAIQKCIALEPKVKHHQEQLARFESVLPGGHNR